MKVGLFIKPVEIEGILYLSFRASQVYNI